MAGLVEPQGRGRLASSALLRFFEPGARVRQRGPSAGASRCGVANGQGDDS